MGDVRILQLRDRKLFDETKAFFEADNPRLRLSIVTVDGEAELRSEHGGMRVFWLYAGSGDVLLPEGYRTQEGDGNPLPWNYTPEALDPWFAEVLGILKDKLSLLEPGADAAIRAIVNRWNGSSFVGDFANDLWKLEMSPRPWSRDKELEAVIASLFGSYRKYGYSTKQSTSYEPVIAGDQLIASGSECLNVRGRFTCLSMENIDRTWSHVSSARRLRFLSDSAGGCNPDFAPFRRLPLTWYMNYPGETQDGVNWVNSHVVNIPKETSPTHFHPAKAISGSSVPQREMYLVLDHDVWQLDKWGRTPSLIVFPDLHDLSKYKEYQLEPGMFVYIPPGTGHRGLDVFANILTVPGFKPHEEYYIDQDVRDRGRGLSPYNENVFASKNYTNIEDFL